MKTIALAMILAVFSSFAADEYWTTNFEEAKEKAAQEEKDLLLFFTGSDWCGWCKKLKKEVLDQEAFQDEAGKKFVFVELDFPKRTKLSEELTAQNKALAQKFGISGYPKLILANAQGEPYSSLGYKNAEGTFEAIADPDEYVQMLSKMKANKSKLLRAQAAGAKAAAKAAEDESATFEEQPPAEVPPPAEPAVAEPAAAEVEAEPAEEPAEAVEQ